MICGGESGGGARDFDLSWAATLLQDCKKARVPYFFKQAGAKPVNSFMTPSGVAPYRLRLADRKGGDLSELPAVLDVREFPRGR